MKTKTKFLLLTALALPISGFCTEIVTIPTTGVDVAGYISSAITSLGTTVAAAVGGYVAFLLVKKSLKWVGRALN